MHFFKRIFRALLMLALVVLIVIQFFHPAKNLSGDDSMSIKVAFNVPAEVDGILKTSCNDCHSNYTTYPWYTKIQPVDWWIDQHVREGKEELNFSEFAGYTPRRQYRKFEEIRETVEEGEMPMEVYTVIHREAVLNAAQKEQLMQWSIAMKDSMQRHYPMDSLKRNKKPSE